MIALRDRAERNPSFWEIVNPSVFAIGGSLNKT